MINRKRLSNLFCLLALACFFWPGCTITRGADENSSIWEQSSPDKKIVFSNGRLILTPPDKNWGNTLAYGRSPVVFWTREGFTISLRITIKTTAKGGNGDTTVWIGLTPDCKAGSIQASDAFAGIALTVNSAKGGVYASLARKEANGSNERTRGDSHGNIVNYGQWPGVQVPLKSDTFDLTLKFTEDRISASIAGSPYSESFPSGLSKEIWNKAYLSAQCMNCNDGRGSLSIELLSSTPDIALLDKIIPLNLRPLANMGFKDEIDGDKQGGWADQGANDLRHIVTGRQNLRAIPFDIIDPVSNNGKSCLMLYSKNKDFFPKELGPVAINRKAASLIFLHSAAWASKATGLAATYRVSYSDGTSVDIPVKVDAQISDWWGMKELSDPGASLFLKIKSDKSANGTVGIYGYRWVNPNPDKIVRSLSFISAEADPVVGILAVSLVPEGLGATGEALLKIALAPVRENDYKKNPPDAKEIPDQVFLKTAKTLAKTAFSVAGNYRGGDGGETALKQDGYAALIEQFGGIARYPYGLEISFYFWPYQAKDWYPVLGRKGGNYGTIEKWFYKYGKPDLMLSYQTILENYKRMGLKLILLFNCHSMFNGKDFVYIKTMPEDKMKRQNPLDGGEFSQANLDAIVQNNATLVDYIIKNGYEDTIAYWEMDNELWDMPGREYAETVAAHVKMLRSKLPKAKVIVCLGELAAYSSNPEGVHAVVWSKDLLAGLKALGMNGQIDCFAPHLYPFLHDKVNELMQNHLEDYSVRNIYRSLDCMEALLDKYGFAGSKFYISEWGTQSDEIGNGSRNELINSMAAAIATAKDMMAIYSHPRVEGSTLHTFMHASYVSRELGKPLSQWGCQTVFIDAVGKRFIGTPVSEAVKLFIQFTKDATLTPDSTILPSGIHCLRADSKSGVRYFVVNSTPNAFNFPAKGTARRLSLFADNVALTSILKYWTYGDKPGEVREIVPRSFENTTLPPYSINIVE